MERRVRVTSNVVPKLGPDDVRAFLGERARLVRIATVDGDGAPHLVPAWFLFRDDRILVDSRIPQDRLDAGRSEESEPSR